MDAANWRSTLRNRRAASSPKRGAPKVTHSAAVLLLLAGTQLSPRRCGQENKYIWEQCCCGSGMFIARIPDPNFSIPDLKFFYPGSRIRIKEFKYFNPKNCF
jgi:hypothetical protein